MLRVVSYTQDCGTITHPVTRLCCSRVVTVAASQLFPAWSPPSAAAAAAAGMAEC